MIITCPNCSTRYSLPQEKIKPDGQKVRCAKCGTVWHQEPEELSPAPMAQTADEPVAAAPAPAWSPPVPPEPEPAAASPAPPEPPPVPQQPEAVPAAAAAEPEAASPASQPMRPDSFSSFHMSPSSDEAPSGKGRTIAIVVVILVVLALGVLVVFKQQVQDLTGIPLVSMRDLTPPAAKPTETVPGAAAPATAPEPTAPEPMTLTLEEVESYTEEIEGIKRLVVKGVVSNFGDREQVIPQISFQLRDKDGNELDVWVFDPPQPRLGPHLNIKFEKSRELPPQALYDLNPRFVDPDATPPSAPSAVPASAPAATPQ